MTTITVGTILMNAVVVRILVSTNLRPTLPSKIHIVITYLLVSVGLSVGLGVIGFVIFIGIAVAIMQRRRRRLHRSECTTITTVPPPPVYVTHASAAAYPTSGQYQQQPYQGAHPPPQNSGFNNPNYPEFNKPPPPSYS